MKSERELWLEKRVEELTRERDEARADRLRYSLELNQRTTQLQRAEARRIRAQREEGKR